MPEESHFSLRDALGLFYRKIAIFKITLVVLPLAVFLACFLLPPVYESTAKVIVTGKQENTTLLQVPADRATSSFFNLNVDEIDLNSEMELLKSIDLWILTVKKLGLKSLRKSDEGAWKERLLGRIRTWKKELFGGEERKEPGNHGESPDIVAAAKSLMANLKVVPTPKSKVLDLSFRYSDPIMAERILSTFLNEYVPYHQQVYSMPEAQGFFQNQEDMFFEKWQDAQNKVKAFKAEWGISSPEKQKGELIALIKQIQEALVGLNANLNQYEKMLVQLKSDSMPTGQLAPSPQRGNENTVISVIATQLFRAKQQLVLTKQNFAPESREYREAQALVEKVTDQFINTLETEIGILKAKKASLEKSLNEKKASLEMLEQKTEELRKLELAATIEKERYIQYASKQEEARVESVKGGRKLVNVSVLARPFTPVAPVFPQTALMVLGAFVVAVPLGIALILIANFLDHTFDTPSEVENSTGVPVLASLTRLPRNEGAKA
ncbi:MAG: Wzz/FepE/Etk N-terminal domain-containing protein [Thermodesulfobacteriota bacterium]